MLSLKGNLPPEPGGSWGDLGQLLVEVWAGLRLRAGDGAYVQETFWVPEEVAVAPGSGPCLGLGPFSLTCHLRAWNPEEL